MIGEGLMFVAGCLFSGVAAAHYAFKCAELHEHLEDSDNRIYTLKERMKSERVRSSERLAAMQDELDKQGLLHCDAIAGLCSDKAKIADELKVAMRERVKLLDIVDDLEDINGWHLQEAKKMQDSIKSLEEKLNEITIRYEDRKNLACRAMQLLKKTGLERNEAIKTSAHLLHEITTASNTIESLQGQLAVKNAENSELVEVVKELRKRTGRVLTSAELDVLARMAGGFDAIFVSKLTGLSVQHAGQLLRREELDRCTIRRIGNRIGKKRIQYEVIQ